MKKRRSAEQIVGILRQADVELGKGQKVPEVCRQLGISEQTYHRWKGKYGGLGVSEARRLKQLEDENARLLAEHQAAARTDQDLKAKLQELQVEKKFYLDEIRRDSILTRQLQTDTAALEKFAREVAG